MTRARRARKAGHGTLALYVAEHASHPAVAAGPLRSLGKRSYTTCMQDWYFSFATTYLAWDCDPQ